MTIMVERAVFGCRVMNGNNPASLQESHPTVIYLAYAFSGLVTVEKKQIDRGRPGTGHFFRASLMNLNPGVETDSVDIPFEKIAERSTPVLS